MIAWIRVVLLLVLLATLTLPVAQADDPLGMARYEAVFQGAWADGPDPVVEELQFRFLPAEWIRGPEGRWVATYPVAWSGPELHREGWRSGEGIRYLDVSDGAWVASARLLHDGRVAQESVFDVVRTWRAESWAGAAADFLPDGARDCLVLPSLGGPLHCQVPGVTGIITDVRTAPADRPGMDRHLVAADSTTRIDVWHAKDVPYASRVEVRDVHDTSSRLVLRLIEWEPWSPMEPGPSGLIDLEPVRLGHDPYFLPSEAGMSHLFSLRDAVVGALSEPASGFVDDRETTPSDERHGLEDYLASRQAYVYHAEYMRYDDDPPDHEWLVGWTDGHSTLWVKATRDGDPPPLVNGLLDADNITFAYIDRPQGDDPYLPRITEARSMQPPVAEMMRFYRAYSANGTVPYAWGMHAGCTGCPPGTLRFWAGTAETQESTQENGTESIVTTTVEESYIHMDRTGAVLGYEERVRTLQEGQGYGPDSLDAAAAAPGIAGPLRPVPMAAAPVAAEDIGDKADTEPGWLAALPVAALALAGWVLRRRA